MRVPRTGRETCEECKAIREGLRRPHKVPGELCEEHKWRADDDWFLHDCPDGQHYFCSAECLDKLARDWPVTPYKPEPEAAPYTDVPIKAPLHHGWRDVSQHIEVKQTATGKLFALMDIGAFMRPGSLPDDALEAADASAMAALDRAAKSKGGYLGNKRKRSKYGSRNAQLLVTFNKLVREGLAANKSEKAARADAHKALAAQENVQPQRMRDIIRDARKRANPRSSASR
ncbi:MAG: hypothetical protein HY699_11730 [Deltaproteobacteria bacterium]|nr:hypothetical protein [Deltaproteobacteria bacterium]